MKELVNYACGIYRKCKFNNSVENISCVVDSFFGRD